MSLTKIDIIESAYEQLDIPKKDCTSIVESLFDLIKEDLGKGHDVMISGFGKWTVKAKKKRRGRNPQTGEVLTIDARRVVTFKPSTVLKDAINWRDRGFAVAEKLDSNQVVDLQELLMSGIIQSEALINLLAVKGSSPRRNSWKR